jgi:hypothetical protein
MKHLFALLFSLAVPNAVAQTVMPKGDYWAEAQISEARPYVQQSLVYMILVISKVSLERVEHSPPSVSGMALERLDEQPLNYPFNMDGRRYNITAFRYALTPLTLGKLEIPPAKVKITTGQRPYAWPGTVSRAPIELETNAISVDIQPPVAEGVKNWLPLISLKISAKLDKPATPKVGEPFTLTLIQDATGAGGESLPPLESLLHSEDFKIYPERPLSSREVTPDGSILVLAGQRKEVYTLIPQREGNLQLPNIDVHWWDVRKKQAATTSWQPPVIRVGESLGNVVDDAEPLPLQLTQVYFWMAMQAVLVFLLGWWMGKGMPGSVALKQGAIHVGAYFLAFIRVLTQGSQNYARRSYQNLVAAFIPYVPIALRAAPDAKRWRTRLARWLLPRRVRMLWHIRTLNDCESASACAAHLRDFARLYLDMPRNSALPNIGETLCRLYPHLDKMRILGLMRELDAFMYAPRRDEDVIEWQSAFASACHSLPWHSPRWRTVTPDKFPYLNPSF